MTRQNDLIQDVKFDKIDKRTELPPKKRMSFT